MGEAAGGGDGGGEGGWGRRRRCASSRRGPDVIMRSVDGGVVVRNLHGYGLIVLMTTGLSLHVKFDDEVSHEIDVERIL